MPAADGVFRGQSIESIIYLNGSELAGVEIELLPGAEAGRIKGAGPPLINPATGTNVEVPHAWNIAPMEKRLLESRFPYEFA
jgi:hypothetical protein